MTELKPCPFCGQLPDIVYDDYEGRHRPFIVKCKSCAVSMYVPSWSKDPFEMWNRRVQDGN